MADIIKFRTAKKALARKRKDQAAIENRVKFGRTKAEKSRDANVASEKRRHLDGHRLESDPETDKT